MIENLFETFAWNDPDRMLIRGTEPVSYGQMHALSGRMSNALADLGVAPGDRVAVQVEKSVEALALYLACLRAGAVFLPMNTAYTVKELEFFIADATPALVVCDPRLAEGIEAIPGAKGRVKTLDPSGNGSFVEFAAGKSSEQAVQPRDPADVAAILYTSGTTGRPKGAMLTHRNLSSNAAALREAWCFTSNDVLLHALPIYHAHGLFVASNLVMLTGGSMHFLPKFDPDTMIRLMPESTSMMGVPTFYTRLLAHEELGAASKGMRVFISGSAPLLPETHRRWHDVTGHAILERYGMTETTMLTSNPYDGDRKPGSVGQALPGVSVRIADPESGAPLSPGEVGMIEVAGPNIFKGYRNLPEKTAAEFRPDGYFMTGDLGYVDNDGYIFIVGRGKDLVITGGLNVYPREVEAEIDEVEGVLEAAVIGLPHSDFGEGVTAVVVQRPGGNLTEAQVLAALDGRVSKFKLPKRVIFVDELPRNTMGKVQKNLLRDTYANLYAPADAERGRA